MGSSFGYNLQKAISLSAVLLIAGCHSNQQPAASAGDQTQQQVQASSDPASVNLAPAVFTTTPAPAAAQNPPSSGYDNSSASSYDDSADESDYGIEPGATAPDPPPSLPDYDQPPCPGDGYLWTPGYWDYASTGYYWVPGAWVQAPYEGALWTPGYWAYSRGRYSFFHGYWGPHIGFYGGINYGFGYTGIGYQGGYWNSGRFQYNRTVNNINTDVVHNVYNYKVVNVNNRVSFNGGSGGVQVRPRPAEIAALREPHAAPMRTQIEIRQAASNNRAQFASVNRGRPQQFTAPRPVAADRDVRPAPAQGLRNLPPVSEAHRTAPIATQEPNRAEPNRPAPNEQQANRPGQQPSQPNRPEPEHRQLNHPAPAQNNFRPAEPNRPEPMQTAPARREVPPQQNLQPAPQEHRQPPTHPMPEQHAPANHPAPEQHAAPANHPAPEQHAAPANHPAPEQHAAPANHPAPEEHRQPQPEHNDDHPHL
jgi:hypothetical protein